MGDVAGEAEGAVQVDESGLTLAAWARQITGGSWNQAKRACAAGHVFVDDERALDPAARPPAGARVEVRMGSRRVDKGGLAPEAVLHLDAHVIVVDKPAALLTVRADDDRESLVDRVRAHLRRVDGRRGGRDPWLAVVQRLDKDTTGALVIARTETAKASLKAQLFDHTVTRRYRAIVHGHLSSTRYESDVVQDRGDGLRGSWGARPHHRGPPPPRAKRCVTHARRVEVFGAAGARDAASLVECRLETGRQHQIRIHLSEAGHAIVGETVYIRDHAGPRIDAPRPMLHAAELAFDHPATGERIRFESPLPLDFRRTLARLRG